MTEWLTSAEAANYARVSINTLRDAAECGDLSGVKVTPGSTRSQWRFRPADVDAWLERGRVTGLRRPRRRRGAA
jgi:excisionase family DNA binding protein